MKNYIFLAGFLIVIIGTSCKKPQGYLRLTGHTMGTYYAITYLGDAPEETRNDIETILKEFNQSVSTYIPTSTISKLNKSRKGIKINTAKDKYFISILQKSNEIYNLTEGDFNTSVMPLVNYWGFGYKDKIEVSSVDSIHVDSLLQIVKASKFTCSQKGEFATINKSTPLAEIDFSSLAKGKGIDVIATYFDTKNVQNYLIDIGGEARAKGVNNTNNPWRLAISKPKDNAAVNDIELALNLNNMSIATSGNYRIFYISEGKKHAHIINPKTGYPALSNLLSVSILAPDCMTADALATAMMVKGLEEAKSFLIKNSYPACLIYDADGDTELEKFYINGFEDLL
ncbi:MAG: FAD:protein FMN transferase [Saprospiraceae bacterium]